jgi:hypothetical protein
MSTPSFSGYRLSGHKVELATLPGFVRLLCVGVATAMLASCETQTPVVEVGDDKVVATAAARASELAGVPGVQGPFEDFVDRSAYKTAYRRITEGQYRNTIADIFGPGIEINTRFEPERREEGLQAIGNAQLSITTTGLEQYISVARSIADQALDEESRDRQVGCAPKAPGAADAGCAERFIRTTGHLLFRRPLKREEVDQRLELWRAGAQQSGDFHNGLKLALSSLLSAPEFLFRVERAEADPAAPDQMRLDGYTKAMRLSHMLWDAAPDAELLEVARSGEIHTVAGLSRQMERLLASPRFERGVRAFFADMLHFEAFDTLSKDAQTYPRFSQAIADSAREETLRFLVDHLVTAGRDYREIFTSKETILNRSLAAIYDVPYPSADPWTKLVFPETSERSGILTQVSFLALHSHPASSSPTIRGVRLNEIFLCTKIPDPPPDVDFSKVQALEKGTVRTRLIDHMTNPGCSACHLISDPPGLALERFNGLGEYRREENGQPIDVSAELNGRSYTGAAGVGAFLKDHPQVPACLVRNVYYYGQGRPIDYSEFRFLTRQAEDFAKSGYKLVDLYRSLIMSPEFFKVTPPKGLTVPTTIVSSATPLPMVHPSNGATQ